MSIAFDYECLTDNMFTFQIALSRVLKLNFILKDWYHPSYYWCTSHLL